MNAETFQVYKHSGKFGVHGPILSLIAAVVIGVPLGIVYAYLVRWIPFIYVNFFATLGYGFCVGMVAGFLLKMAKVRNNGIAGITGLLVGLIGLYCAWSGYLFAMSETKRLIWWPDQIIHAMNYLYENGSWGLRSGGPVTGVLLAIVWVVEAVIIVGVATLAAICLVAKTPFCEVNQCWLDKEKEIDTLAPFTDPEHLAASKAGDLAPLAKARPKSPGVPTFTRLILKHSPKCDVFYTVQVQEVTTTLDKDGSTKENAKDLSEDLMLPHSMFELIARFENFKPAEPAASSAPPPLTI